MKRLALTNYLMLFMALIIISACSDSNSPSTSGEYFTMNNGSWWVYAVSTTDENNAPLNSVDSVAVSGTETKEGKLASILTTFSNGESSTSQNMYSDGSKLYTLLSSLLPDAQSGFPIPENLFPTGWAIIADNGGSSWTILDLPLTGIKLNDPSVGEVTLNGKILVTGKKGSTASVTGAGKTWNAQEFIISYTLDATIKSAILPIALPLKFTVTTHNFYADKVGLVKTVSDETNISIKNPLDGSDIFSQKIPASTSIITKYNIATATK